MNPPTQETIATKPRIEAIDNDSAFSAMNGVARELDLEKTDNSLILPTEQQIEAYIHERLHTDPGPDSHLEHSSLYKRFSEKRIYHSPNPRSDGPLVYCITGFSSSVLSMAILRDVWQTVFDLGGSVCLTPLRGHGGEKEDLHSFTKNDWHVGVEEDLTELTTDPKTGKRRTSPVIAISYSASNPSLVKFIDENPGVVSDIAMVSPMYYLAQDYGWMLSGLQPAKAIEDLSRACFSGKSPFSVAERTTSYAKKQGIHTNHDEEFLDVTHSEASVASLLQLLASAREGRKHLKSVLRSENRPGIHVILGDQDRSVRCARTEKLFKAHGITPTIYEGATHRVHLGQYRSRFTEEIIQIVRQSRVLTSGERVDNLS